MSAWNSVSTGSASCNSDIISFLSSCAVMIVKRHKMYFNYFPLTLCGSKLFSVFLNNAICLGCTMK